MGMKLEEETGYESEMYLEKVAKAETGYGCVATAMFNNQKVAVKKVPVPTERHEDDSFRLLREVILLQKIQKEHRECLTPLIDMYTNVDCASPEELKFVYLIMPFYASGCLEDFSVNTPELFYSIASQTLDGLHWLHSHDVLHRDIKRENVFYDAATKRAVLGDLGSCRRNDREWRMSGRFDVGTSCYLAPEMNADLTYSFASDVWALGCVWYEMLCLENGAECLFPYEDATAPEILAKQKAFCRYVNPQLFTNRRITQTQENMTWSRMTWNLVEAKEEEWKEEAYARLFRKIFVFDQAHRALTADLYQDAFFANVRAKPENVVIAPLGEEMDILDYEMACDLLFDLRTIQPPLDGTCVESTRDGDSDDFDYSPSSNSSEDSDSDNEVFEEFKELNAEEEESGTSPDVKGKVKRRKSKAGRRRGRGKSGRR